MFTRLFRFALTVLIACFVLAALGCAGNRKPDVVIAQTHGDILDGATQLQQEVNRLVAARTLPVALGDQFVKYNTVISEKSHQLIPALEAYHAATTPLEKQNKAQLVQTLITEVSGPLGQMLGLKVPEGVTTSISKLIGLIMQGVAAVQAQVAQGLGAGGGLLLPAPAQ